MIKAVSEGNLSEVVRLFDSYPNDKGYLLEIAAKNGHLPIIKYLVDKGVDINSQAIVWATRGGHLDIVKYLVDNGADVNSRGDKAIVWAADGGHLEVVKYLVSKGVDVNSSRGMAIVVAAKSGHLEVVKYLANRGADVNSYDGQAIVYAVENGHLDIVKYLVNRGADFNSQEGIAIVHAAGIGRLDIIKYLVDKGADVNSQGSRAIVWATRGNRLEIVKYLIENGSMIPKEIRNNPQLTKILREFQKSELHRTIQRRGKKRSKFEYSSTKMITHFEDACSDLSGKKLREIKEVLERLKIPIVNLNNREICYLLLVTYDSLKELIDEFYSRPYYSDDKTRDYLKPKNCNGDTKFPITQEDIEGYSGSVLFFKDNGVNRCYSIEDVEFIVTQKFEPHSNRKLSEGDPLFQKLLEFKQNYDKRFKLPKEIQRFIEIMRDTNMIRYSSASEEDALLNKLNDLIGNYSAISKLREFLNKPLKDIKDSLRGTVLENLPLKKRKELVTTFINALSMDDNLKSTRAMALATAIYPEMVRDFEG